MKNYCLDFNLDYGTCFWESAAEDGGKYDGPLAEEVLSPDVQREVTTFLEEYDQCYTLGCPPSEGWTVEDCRRFNGECKRILMLTLPELSTRFMVCICQLDLIENPDLLADFYRRGRAFMEERAVSYYGGGSESEVVRVDT